MHLIFRLLSQPPSFCSQAELPKIGGLGSGFRLRPFEAGQRQACHVDVAKARNFDEVVEALTSNTEDRTNQVTLIFERPTA